MRCRNFSLVLAAVLASCASIGGTGTQSPKALHGDAANRELIATLRAGGADLTKPTSIGFSLYEPTRALARRVAADLARRGYICSIVPPSARSANVLAPNAYDAYARVEHVVTLAFIHREERFFAREARRYQGAYAGWDAAIVR